MVHAFVCKQYGVLNKHGQATEDEGGKQVEVDGGPDAQQLPMEDTRLKWVKLYLKGNLPIRTT